MLASPLLTPNRQEQERLNSWKEIAAFLERSVRTVQRWEKENGLPVHRVALNKGAAIYALKSELNQWWACRSTALTGQAESVENHEIVPDASSQPVFPWVAVPIAPGLSRSRVFWAIGVGLFLLGVAIAVVAGRIERTQPILTGIPVVTHTGMNLHPVLSPSGKRVAYVNDKSDIYIQQLGADLGHQVTTNGCGLSVAWSTDGKRLAYLQRAEGRSAELWVADVSSGQRRRIARTQLELGVFPRGASLAWSPQGDFILASDRPNPQETAGLFAFPVGEGSMQRLTSPPDPTWKDISPQISPDGRILAFLREKQIHQIELCYAPMRRNTVGETICLSLPQTRIYGFAFGSDSTHVYASLADVGLQGHLWKIPLHSPANAVQLPLSEATALEPSYAAGTLIYVAGAIRVALNEYQTGNRPDLHSDIVAPSNGIEIHPTLSPDGKRLAFVSNRSGAYDVWVVNAEGRTDPRRVSFLDGQTAGDPLWSPDGSQIAFSEMVGGTIAVTVVSLTGEKPHRFTLRESPPYVPRGWTAGKRALYVETGRRTKQTALVKLDLATGAEEVILNAPGTATLGIAPDGLALLENNSKELTEIEPGTGERRILARGAWTEFSVQGSNILLKSSNEPDRTTSFAYLRYPGHRLVSVGSFPCDGPGATLSAAGNTLICSASKLNTDFKYVALQ